MQGAVEAYEAWTDISEDKRTSDFRAYAYNIAEARYVARRVTRIINEQAKKFGLDPLLHQALLQTLGTPRGDELAVWEIADHFGFISFDFLPRPSSIIVAADEQLVGNQLLPAIGHTVGIALLGRVFGSVVGIAPGCLLGVNRTAWTYGMATVDVVRSLPSIVLLPIALLLFGFSIEQELFLILWGTIWPVLVTTVEGVRATPRPLLEAGATLRLPRADSIRKIVLPSALPPIFVGLRLGLIHSFILAIAAEMLGNPSGMGYALVRAQEALQPGDMFVYLLAVGFLGILFNAMFLLASRILFRGHAARSERAHL